MSECLKLLRITSLDGDQLTYELVDTTLEHVTDLGYDQAIYVGEYDGVSVYVEQLRT